MLVAGAITGTLPSILRPFRVAIYQAWFVFLEAEAACRSLRTVQRGLKRKSLGLYSNGSEASNPLIAGEWPRPGACGAWCRQAASYLGARRKSRGGWLIKIVIKLDTFEPMPRVKIPRAGRALKVLWQGKGAELLVLRILLHARCTCSQPDQILDTLCPFV